MTTLITCLVIYAILSTLTIIGLTVWPKKIRNPLFYISQILPELKGGNYEKLLLVTQSMLGALATLIAAYCFRGYYLNPKYDFLKPYYFTFYAVITPLTSLISIRIASTLLSHQISQAVSDLPKGSERDEILKKILEGNVKTAHDLVASKGG